MESTGPPALTTSLQTLLESAVLTVISNKHTQDFMYQIKAAFDNLKLKNAGYEYPTEYFAIRNRCDEVHKFRKDKKADKVSSSHSS